ncbi:MAG: PDZ domain-containing protein [Actinobacteria bacterium]|nr:MAG: PDZ domain-containing protein [Actinomycetota bacterium]
MPRALNYLLVFVLVVVMACGGFIGGVLYERHRAAAVAGADSGPAAVGDTVDEVREMLLHDALEPSDDASMTAGAVRGLLSSLGDKYAEYFDARHYGYFKEDNAGEFGGIGVTLTQKDADTVVVSVMSGTPAEKAGIKKNDVFYGIDGERREGWDEQSVVKLVRGEPGTKVALEMRRPGVKDPVKFTITRAVIKVPNVESKMIGSDVGYISMAQFNERSAEDLGDALRALDGKGARGFVLDLRDDPGGSLDESVDVASLFVADGVITSVEYRDRPGRDYEATGWHVTDKPLVVLVNGYSASASEIVAGALQGYGRAELGGGKTVGKGGVQTVEPLGGGGAGEVTSAPYLTPEKRKSDGGGLTRDGGVAVKTERVGADKGDIQLDRAVAELRKQL